MLKKLLILLFSFGYWNLSAQILKTDSSQNALFLDGLILKQKYKPKFNIEDVDANDYRELITKGVALYESENFADAYAVFKLAEALIDKYAENPNLKQSQKYYSSTPLLMMALCEIKQEHDDSAFVLLRKVIEKDPINVDAYDELGMLYAYQDKYDSAIIQFKKAISINARFEKSYYHLAYIYSLRNNLLSARATMIKLIDINPLNEQYHLMLAHINEQKKQIKDAEKEYNAAIALNLSVTKNYFYRGAFLFRQKRYVEAIADFQICVQRDSSDLAFLEGLTTSYMHNAEFERGLENLYLLLTKMDTASSSFKLDLSLVETLDLLKMIRQTSVDSAEKAITIKLLGLTYNDAIGNSAEIANLASTLPQSEICQRLYFLSLYVGSDHQGFKYQLYRLYAINDSLPNTYMMEATMANAANSTSKRIDAVKKAISINSNNPTYYYILALLNAFDDSDCKKNIDIAIKMDPKFDLAYIAMGNIYTFKEKYDSALYYYQLGIKNTSSKTEGYYLMGSCYLSNNRIDSALFYLTKTIKLNPTLYYVYLKRSMAFTLYEQFDKAHKDVDSALRIFPESIDAQEQRAKIYIQEKKYEQALKVYNQLLKKYPNEPSIFLDRGNVYFEMKKFDLALVEFKLTLTYWPYSPYALRRTAVTYLALQDSNNALRHFKRALETQKNGGTKAFLYSASIYTEAGYYDEALKFYSYALKADDKNITAIGNMGWVYYKKGDLENCLKYSKKAIAYDSTAMFAKYNLALCELRLGNVERANFLYTEFIKQSQRMGHPKPKGAIEDIEALIALNIYAKEGQSIIDDIIIRLYK